MKFYNVFFCKENQRTCVAFADKSQRPTHPQYAPFDSCNKKKRNGIQQTAIELNVSSHSSEFECVFVSASVNVVLWLSGAVDILALADRSRPVSHQYLPPDISKRLASGFGHSLNDTDEFSDVWSLCRTSMWRSASAWPDDEILHNTHSTMPDESRND